jgi:hypothetical protein
MKGKRITYLSPERPTTDQLIAAACTINAYEASRLLGVRQAGNYNGVPDDDFFRAIFTFTEGDLKGYLGRNADTARDLVRRSSENRGIPAPFLRPTADGYIVGLFGSARSRERQYAQLVDAATDFVLSFWGLSRNYES